MEFNHITSSGNARFQHFSIHHGKNDSDVCSPLISNVIDTKTFNPDFAAGIVARRSAKQLKRLCDAGMSPTRSIP
ncbi:MAG TPA: hypothetical protein VMW95_00865 [Desulfobacterales bacterium]|nr:hypothetical protein [Desulfobacterales bacterium]